MRRTKITRQAITGSTSIASARKSFQFVVGASRQRATPRSQSFSAARLRSASSTVTVGRSEIAPPQRVPSTKCFDSLNENNTTLVVIRRQAVKMVRPNWSLNRTLCGSPGLGFKSVAQTRPTAKCRLARTLGPAEKQSDLPSLCQTPHPHVRKRESRRELKLFKLHQVCD